MLTPVLRTGTFATHTVVPQVAAVKVPRELPVEQACLIGCAVATGVMSVLETAKVWEGARVAVIGCGAVGLSVDPGRADRRRVRDPRDRPRRAQARAGAALRRDAHRAGAGRLRLRRRRARRDLRAGARAARDSGGTFVLIGLSPAGETAELDLPQLFAKRARILVSHGGDHLPQEDFPRLAQWALDGKLDLAGDGHAHRAARRLEEALEAMNDGDVIRTVLTP